MTEKINILKNTKDYKPEDLIIRDLHWKTILYSVMNGENLLISGPTGSGKTKALLSLKELYATNADFVDYNFVNIPMGGSQDARSTLIGNTHLSKENGTWFETSKFVNAIQTPNTTILLDEVNRGDLQSGNILMSVLDENQRFLQIDDSPTTPDIKLADGVCIIATANIGREYTATNLFDLAFKERFCYFNMPIISLEDEIKLQKLKHPNISDDIINKICNISEFTRVAYKNEGMSYYISTKNIHQFLKKMRDDIYTFEGAFEMEILNRMTQEDDISLLNQYLDTQ